LICEALAFAYEKPCLSILVIAEIFVNGCCSHLESRASSRSRRNIGPSSGFLLQRRWLCLFRIARTMSMVVDKLEGMLILEYLPSPISSHRKPPPVLRSAFSIQDTAHTCQSSNCALTSISSVAEAKNIIMRKVYIYNMNVRQWLRLSRTVRSTTLVKLRALTTMIIVTGSLAAKPTITWKCCFVAVRQSRANCHLVNVNNNSVLYVSHGF